MAIKRYPATADNTITNAFKANLQTRGTGSNMGASDVLEVFNIYAQSASTSLEKSRILIKFDTTQISTDRTAGLIPASGSVSWYLRMFNAKHGETLPRTYDMVVIAASQSWEEGFGLDMVSYSDQTYEGTGSNWARRGSSAEWALAGGDYHTGSSADQGDLDPGTFIYTASFDKGYEDLEQDITNVVEYWIAGTYTNNGLGVMLDPKHEDDSRSYYTKKFFARESEFFFKRPIIEARWDSARKDDRGNFFYSSSLAPAADNLNTLYLYNYVRGQLQNIPAVGDSDIYVAIYSGTTSPVEPELVFAGDGTDSGGATISTLYVTGGYVDTGIYSASLCLTAAANDPVYEDLFDVWFSGDPPSRTIYFTGSIVPEQLEATLYNKERSYVTAIADLRDSYATHENSARFRLYVREKGWNPNIYTIATASLPNTTIDNAYYRLFRTIDNFEIIDYGTGSATAPQADGTDASYTRMSFDVSGNYFDLDISMLEPGYSYGLNFVYFVNGTYVQQLEAFKFRVEE